MSKKQSTKQGEIVVIINLCKHTTQEPLYNANRKLVTLRQGKVLKYHDKYIPQGRGEELPRLWKKGKGL